MTDSESFHRNFSEWAALARRDPSAFEAMREARVQGVIERAPAERRRRLEALQWRIDQECTRAASPLEAARRVSGMMWDSLLGAGGLLERLRAPRPPPSSDSGQVRGQSPKVVVLYPKKP